MLMLTAGEMVVHVAATKLEGNRRTESLPVEVLSGRSVATACRLRICWRNTMPLPSIGVHTLQAARQQT